MRCAPPRILATAASSDHKPVATRLALALRPPRPAWWHPPVVPPPLGAAPRSPAPRSPAPPRARGWVPWVWKVSLLSLEVCTVVTEECSEGERPGCVKGVAAVAGCEPRQGEREEKEG
jgi:hypothetical protein